MITAKTPFRRVGPCQPDDWVNVARMVESPIPEKELAEMHEAAGVHSALCLSQCVKESTLGRDQSARTTRNPLGLMQADGKTLLRFEYWSDAVDEWVRRICDLSYKGGVYSPEDCTLEQYLSTYVGGPGCWETRGKVCANGETWDGSQGGSVGLYISQTIERLMDYTDGGKPTMPPTNRFRVPTTYKLNRDYARFGLSLAQANKVMSHKFVDRGGSKVSAIVLHIQEGTTPSSLSWWASGNADASSTAMVQKDGTVLMVLDPKDGPWTNGDVSAPSEKGRALLDRIGNINPNRVTLSIEAEGRSGDNMGESQLNAMCWLITDWMITYGLGIKDIYKHADFNSTSRAFCPGKYWDVVINKLNEVPLATDAFWPNKPVWLPAEMVKPLFPEADPEGVRTNAWFAECERLGRAPRRVAFHGQGAQQIIEFSDGTLIDANGKVVGRA